MRRDRGYRLSALKMFDKIKETWELAKLMSNRRGETSADKVIELSFAVLILAVIGMYAISTFVNATTGNAVIDALIPPMGIIIMVLFVYGLYKQAHP